MLDIILAFPSKGSGLQACQVGFDHHLDQGFKADLRRPAQVTLGPAGVGHQGVGLRWAVEGRVDDHVVAVVEVHGGEGCLAQVAHAVELAGADHVILGRLPLQHEPHGAHIVAGKAPVALGVEVAQAQLVGQAEFDLRGTVGDLAGDELQPAAWAFVVVEHPGYGIQPVLSAVVAGDQVPVNLGDPVGVARVEAGGDRLGGLIRIAEHLAGGGLVEARLGRHLAGAVQHPCHAQRGRFGRQHGLGPGELHVGLSAQVVDLVRVVGVEGLVQRTLVEQVALDQFDLVLDVLDAAQVEGAGAAHHAHHAVAFGEQELGQVRAVLPGNAGDQRGCQSRFSFAQVF
jgi:hypothetical protein